MDNNSGKCLDYDSFGQYTLLRVADGAVGGHGNSGNKRLPSLITANGVVIRGW